MASPAAAMDGPRKHSESFEQEAGNVSLAPGSGGGGVPQASFGNVSLSSTVGGSTASMAGPPPAAAAPSAPPFPAVSSGGGGGGGGGGFQGAAQAHMQQAATDAAQEVAMNAVRSAGSALRTGLQWGTREITVYVQANPKSVTMMSFIGGCWLIVTSLLNIITIFSLAEGLLLYILQFYQVFFGLLIVFVDGPVDKIPQGLRMKVLNYASFLHNNVSRMLFYLFIACQQGSLGHWYNVITGWYFAAVAVLYGFVQFVAPSPQLAPPMERTTEGPTTSFTSAAH